MNYALVFRPEVRQELDSYAVVYRDVRRAVLRRFPYAVYYRIISSRVVVTAVFHSRRDPKIWQDRT
ncbi:hypothetical protein C7B64_11345 [Merismopedia glauca CCAP 1448/3]|uniref:Type II toxin-antitoxin system RelE/ParE family toxin n=2 Tax=Merismopedia TaxID=53402 RepID=A0A2T1C3M2_9CYAN|nr:hypothetical protein C7B64_11345 [Merismopedia glauca CCAP 1448/3]